jgi:hypothetical protein
MNNLIRVALIASPLLTACVGDENAINKSDCPGAAEGLTLEQPAPVWGGINRLTFKVPGGVPDSLRVQQYDSVSGIWNDSYTSSQSAPAQKDDGTYVATVSAQSNQLLTSADFKLRVRPQLAGCPAPAWSTSESFKLGNPVSGTTWSIHVDPAELDFSQLQAGSNPGGVTQGRYFLSPAGIDHVMQFQAPDIVDETWTFGIRSEQSTDLYHGCDFKIHMVGKWRLSYYYTNLRLIISGLVPATSPLAGSTCASVPLSEMLINQPGPSLRLQPVSSYFGVDYAALLFATPGKARWQDSQQINQLTSLLQQGFLNDAVGPATSQLSGQVSASYSSIYEKQ